MQPILFAWRGIVIHAYPAMLYVALLTSTFLTTYVGQSYGLNADKVAFATVMLVIPALPGTRLLYVAMHWDIFRNDLRRIWNRSEGGMTVYGGLIASLIFSVPLLWALELPFLKFWDAATMGMLCGSIIAKSGCFLQGCCSGRATQSWCGLHLPDHRGVWLRRVPIQLFEMVWAALLLTAMLLWRARAPFPGAIFFGGVGIYAAGRFFLQKYRADHHGKTESGILQTVSVILAALALIGGICMYFFQIPVI
jgi:phosphatidylglycerol:prolipoprotein diacylglycerol transferase